MDAFISHVLEAFRLDAETAAKVFPPSARVLLSFCDRVANDVVSPFSGDWTNDRSASTYIHYFLKQESSPSISFFKRLQPLSSKLGNSWTWP
jgi:hypothetical protein